MMPSVLLRAALKPIFIAQFILSLYLLLRGHNLPGGGFCGGLLAAASFALAGLAFDVSHARRTLRISPFTLMSLGLGLAILSGAVGVYSGAPYMTGVWNGSLWLPGIGSVKLGTPLIFDVGVYLVVLGMTTLVVFSLFERGGPREDHQ